VDEEAFYISKDFSVTVFPSANPLSSPPLVLFHPHRIPSLLPPQHQHIRVGASGSRLRGRALGLPGAGTRQRCCGRPEQGFHGEPADGAGGSPRDCVPLITARGGQGTFACCFVTLDSSISLYLLPQLWYRLLRTFELLQSRDYLPFNLATT
ncbi:unnamed protein product, partial [Urochloa humidicola]